MSQVSIPLFMLQMYAKGELLVRERDAVWVVNEALTEAALGAMDNGETILVTDGDYARPKVIGHGRRKDNSYEITPCDS